MSPRGRALHPVMVQLGDALEQYLADCSSYLWEAEDPQPGSPWDVDRQQPRPPSADPKVPDLSHHPHVAGYWYGVGGADAMLGARSCLSSDSPLSAGALSRVAMEAFAWGAWIWEPDLPLDDRIMRALLCSKHQAEQLIRSSEKHLNAHRPHSGSGLLTPTSETYGDLFLAELKQRKTKLVTDIETVKFLPGRTSSEPLPSLTEVVTKALDAAVGIPGAGQGTYGFPQRACPPRRSQHWISASAGRALRFFQASQHRTRPVHTGYWRSNSRDDVVSPAACEVLGFGGP